MPLRNVPYSSDLNSIETLWSVVKHNLKKLLLLQETPLTMAQFKQLVRQAISLVETRTISNIIKSNRRYLSEMLQRD